MRQDEAVAIGSVGEVEEPAHFGIDRVVGKFASGHDFT
jgi:hypothetical protein